MKVKRRQIAGQFLSFDAFLSELNYLGFFIIHGGSLKNLKKAFEVFFASLRDKKLFMNDEKVL
jgi:hypothetical protein